MEDVQGFDIISGLLSSSFLILKVIISYILLIDFITAQRCLNEIAEYILSFLNYKDLKSSELVSLVWSEAVNEGNLWYQLLQKQAK